MWTNYTAIHIYEYSFICMYIYLSINIRVYVFICLYFQMYMIYVHTYTYIACIHMYVIYVAIYSKIQTQQILLNHPFFWKKSRVVGRLREIDVTSRDQSQGQSGSTISISFLGRRIKIGIFISIDNIFVMY